MTNSSDIPVLSVPIDTVLDSDGSGSLVIDGVTLGGGALVAGTTNVWKNKDQGITYSPYFIFHIVQMHYCGNPFAARYFGFSIKPVSV